MSNGDGNVSRTDEEGIILPAAFSVLIHIVFDELELTEKKGKAAHRGRPFEM
jgi:hypothetical protein